MKRHKILWISEVAMARLFVKQNNEWVLFYRVEEIPEDAKLISNFYSPERQAYGFMFEHESFPETDFGNVPPSFKSFEAEAVKNARHDPNRSSEFVPTNR